MSNNPSSASSIKPEVQSAPSWGYGAIIALILVFAVMMGVRSCNTKADAEKANAATYAEAHPPAPAPPTVVKSGMEPEKFVYDDYPGGCVSLNLGYRVRWYPIGGCMRVHRPNGTEYTECPGDDPPLTALGPGRWKFCRQEARAVGVYIWK